MYFEGVWACKTLHPWNFVSYWNNMQSQRLLWCEAFDRIYRRPWAIFQKLSHIPQIISCWVGVAVCVQVINCIVSIHLYVYIALLGVHTCQKCFHLHASEVLDAVVLQSSCVRRTCTRSLHSNCLGRGSKPYSMRYRQSTLTNRPTCHTIIKNN